MVAVLGVASTIGGRAQNKAPPEVLLLYGVHTSPYTELRLAAYAKAFGAPSEETVFHSADNHIPHVDVYVYPPKPWCPHWIYATDGVSDRRMAVPPEAIKDGVPLRVELMAYSDEFTSSVPGLLKQMIDYAFSQRTFFCPYQTYAFARNPKLAFREVVIAPLLYPSEGYFEPFSIEGDPVALGTVFPVTHREYVRAVQHGTRELLESLAAAGVSPAFDSGRKSAV